MFGDFLMYLESDDIGMSALSCDSLLSFAVFTPLTHLGQSFAVVVVEQDIFGVLGGGGI